jgi:hypothetical protein
MIDLGFNENGEIILKVDEESNDQKNTVQNIE